MHTECLMEWFPQVRPIARAIVREGPLCVDSKSLINFSCAKSFAEYVHSSQSPDWPLDPAHSSMPIGPSSAANPTASTYVQLTM
ncbi:hypothetical protein ACTXT7_011497 [Hymenolepis weldensis]